MDLTQYQSVTIAVREAPFRRITIDGANNNAGSVIKFLDVSPNAVIVEGNAYSFDHCFNMSTSQAELYDKLIVPLVQKVLNGFDCTALAYGQTGTGKSYSMGLSAEPLPDEYIGIVPRCLNDILERIAQNEQQEQPDIVIPKHVFASFIEVYKEKAYDLLSPEPHIPIASRGQRRFMGATTLPLRNQQDLQKLLLAGTKKRHVRATNMNNNSSRSHAIVTIHFHRDSFHSRLNFIDLAGSEGVRRTGNEGNARSEGVFINMGLLSINKVMSAMSAGYSLLPYRESILTTVLQESLNLRSHITLLACVSPNASDLSETISTLRFAKSAKQVKLAPQVQNRLEQIEMDLRPTRNTSRQRMTQSHGRLLPNSIVIKHQTALNSKDAVSDSFFARYKRTMQGESLCHNYSEMGQNTQNRAVGTNAKGNSTQNDILFEDQLESVRSRAPSINDYLTLKAQIKELQRLTRAQNAYVQPKPPELDENSNYTGRSSDLSSIAEEDDTLIAPIYEMYASGNKDDRTSISVNGNPSVPRAIPVAAVAPNVSRTRSFNSCPSGRDSIQNCKVVTEPVVLRRSTRIASQSEGVRMAKVQSNPRTRSRSSVNEIIDRFTSDNSNGSKFSRLRQHRASLLSLLNTASVHDLQVLPHIGPKTALAITMQRTVLGKFKNWKQVQKLPVWKDGTWSRFARAVCIEIDN